MRAMGATAARLKVCLLESQVKLLKVLQRIAILRINVIAKLLQMPGSSLMVFDVSAINPGPMITLDQTNPSVAHMDYLVNHADNTPSPAHFHLTTLLWNCRGLNNESAFNIARDLIATHHPDMLILKKLTPQRKGQNMLRAGYPLTFMFPPMQSDYVVASCLCGTRHSLLWM